MTAIRGSVEAAARSMVAGMGSLSPRELVTAEAAFAVAGALDLEADGTKASALSRELRQLLDGFAADKSTAAGDPVQRAHDELEARRRAKATG